MMPMDGPTVDVRAHRDGVLMREIARRLVLRQEIGDIAREMDLTKWRVKRLMRRPEFSDILRSMDETIWGLWAEQARLSAAESLQNWARSRQQDAADALDRILEEGRSEAQIVRSAELILELGGGLNRKAEKTETTVNVNIPTPHVDLLTETLRMSNAARDAEQALAGSGGPPESDRLN